MTWELCLPVSVIEAQRAEHTGVMDTNVPEMIYAERWVEACQCLARFREEPDHGILCMAAHATVVDVTWVVLDALMRRYSQTPRSPPGQALQVLYELSVRTCLALDGDSLQAFDGFIKTCWVVRALVLRSGADLGTWHNNPLWSCPAAHVIPRSLSQRPDHRELAYLRDHCRWTPNNAEVVACAISLRYDVAASPPLSPDQLFPSASSHPPEGVAKLLECIVAWKVIPARLIPFVFTHHELATFAGLEAMCRQGAVVGDMPEFPSVVISLGIMELLDDAYSQAVACSAKWNTVQQERRMMVQHRYSCPFVHPARVGDVQTIIHAHRIGFAARRGVVYSPGTLLAPGFLRWAMSAGHGQPPLSCLVRAYETRALNIPQLAEQGLVWTSSTALDALFLYGSAGLVIAADEAGLCIDPMDVLSCVRVSPQTPRKPLHLLDVLDPDTPRWSDPPQHSEPRATGRVRASVALSALTICLERLPEWRRACEKTCDMRWLLRMVDAGYGELLSQPA